MEDERDKGQNVDKRERKVTGHLSFNLLFIKSKNPISMER